MENGNAVRVFQYLFILRKGRANIVATKASIYHHPYYQNRAERLINIVIETDTLREGRVNNHTSSQAFEQDARFLRECWL